MGKIIYSLLLCLTLCVWLCPFPVARLVRRRRRLCSVVCPAAHSLLCFAHSVCRRCSFLRSGISVALPPCLWFCSLLPCASRSLLLRVPALAFVSASLFCGRLQPPDKTDTGRGQPQPLLDALRVRAFASVLSVAVI